MTKCLQRQSSVILFSLLFICTFSVAEGQQLVLESALPPDAPLNDHLVWIWGLLKLERRHLKSLQSEGATFTIVAPFRSGGIEIKPNGAEFLHLLGVTLTIGAK